MSAQEHNTVSPARARTRTARSGSKRTNHEATAPHLKVIKDKLALINRRWKCKKCQRLTITAGSPKKTEQHDNFTRGVSRRYRARGQR